MRLRCGERTFEPVLRPNGETVAVSVGERTFELAATPVAPGVVLVRDGDRSRELHLARDGSQLHLFWEGVVYTLDEEREGDRAPRRELIGAIEAPMPGRVAAVKVSAGQAVVKGQELLVVEAMKMENALRAPRDGVVRAVHASVGEMVAPGRLLVELEP